MHKINTYYISEFFNVYLQEIFEDIVLNILKLWVYVPVSHDHSLSLDSNSEITLS